MNVPVRCTGTVLYRYRYSTGRPFKDTTGKKDTGGTGTHTVPVGERCGTLYRPVPRSAVPFARARAHAYTCYNSHTHKCSVQGRGRTQWLCVHAASRRRRITATSQLEVDAPPVDPVHIPMILLFKRSIRPSRRRPCISRSSSHHHLVNGQRHHLINRNEAVAVGVQRLDELLDKG